MMRSLSVPAHPACARERCVSSVTDSVGKSALSTAYLVRRASTIVAAVSFALACASAPTPPPHIEDAWEREAPLRALPTPPHGMNPHWEALPFRLTPEKVRLGRW